MLLQLLLLQELLLQQQEVQEVQEDLENPKDQTKLKRPALKNSLTRQKEKPNEAGPDWLTPNLRSIRAQKDESTSAAKTEDAKQGQEESITKADLTQNKSPEKPSNLQTAKPIAAQTTPSNQTTAENKQAKPQAQGVTQIPKTKKPKTGVTANPVGSIKNSQEKAAQGAPQMTQAQSPPAQLSKPVAAKPNVQEKPVATPNQPEQGAPQMTQAPAQLSKSVAMGAKPVAAKPKVKEKLAATPNQPEQGAPPTAQVNPSSLAAASLAKKFYQFGTGILSQVRNKKST